MGRAGVLRALREGPRLVHGTPESWVWGRHPAGRDPSPPDACSSPAPGGRRPQRSRRGAPPLEPGRAHRLRAGVPPLRQRPPPGAPAHLAHARLRGAPGHRAALSAPGRLRRPWARRGPAQPGQGPGERAGRVAAAAVVAAADAGSARSSRGARTAGGHAHSRRASHPAAPRARPVLLRLRLGSGSGVRAGGAEPAPPRVTGPGRRAGPPAGMRSCLAKKAPDVTCSQSARAAPGQVTSAGARLWVQMSRSGHRGRGPGSPLPPSALCPRPAPGHWFLKGPRGIPLRGLGPPPPGSLPSPGMGNPSLIAHRPAESPADRAPHGDPRPAGRAGAEAGPPPPAPPPPPPPEAFVPTGPASGRAFAWPGSAHREPGPAERSPCSVCAHPSPRLPEVGTPASRSPGRRLEAQRRDGLPAPHIS